MEKTVLPTPKVCSAFALVVSLFSCPAFSSETAARRKLFPATENGVPSQYGVTLFAVPAASAAAELVWSVGGELGYVYRHILNGFEAELSEEQAAELAEHSWVESVVQETYLDEPLSVTLPHCYSAFDTNTRPLPPLPGPGNPVPQQTQDCLDPAPGGDCIDNWGLDRVDQLGLPRDESFSYRQAADNVTVFVIDTGVARDNREFDDALGNSRVEPGIHTGCTNYPIGPNCPEGFIPCQGFFDVGKGHGTHVAAILGGRSFGLAKDVSFVPIKALCPGFTTTNYKRALDYVLDNHAASDPTAVVNISGLNSGCLADVGCSSGAQVRAAVVSVASRNNILLVQSAGNQSFLDPPAGPGNILADACDYSFGDEDRYTNPAEAAAIARILIVAGSDENDGLWRTQTGEYGYPMGSNAGTCVDLFAPASDIVSAYYPLDAGSSNPDEIVCQLSGTSMAAPHVSGVAAMMLHEDPSMTTDQLRTMILNWATQDVLENNSADSEYIGDGSPNRLLHREPKDLLRDGFETGDTRLWLVTP